MAKRRTFEVADAFEVPIVTAQAGLVIETTASAIPLFDPDLGTLAGAEVSYAVAVAGFREYLDVSGTLPSVRQDVIVGGSFAPVGDAEGPSRSSSSPSTTTTWSSSAEGGASQRSTEPIRGSPPRPTSTP